MIELTSWTIESGWALYDLSLWAINESGDLHTSRAGRMLNKSNSRAPVERVRYVSFANRASFYNNEWVYTVSNLIELVSSELLDKLVHLQPY